MTDDLTSDEWMNIMNYFHQKWICSYIDMYYYGEILAPTEYMFIKDCLKKFNDNNES